MRSPCVRKSSWSFGGAPFVSSHLIFWSSRVARLRSPMTFPRPDARNMGTFTSDGALLEGGSTLPGYRAALTAQARHTSRRRRCRRHIAPLGKAKEPAHLRVPERESDSI